jgi:hypothetical protein
MSSDDSFVVVGAPYNNRNGSDSGHLRLVQWSVIFLIQLGNEIGGEAAGDKFGQSVLLPSDGARFHDGQSTNSGHVCLLDEAVVAWSPLGNVLVLVCGQADYAIR